MDIVGALLGKRTRQQGAEGDLDLGGGSGLLCLDGTDCDSLCGKLLLQRQ